MPRVKDKGNCVEFSMGSRKITFKKQCKLTKTINDLLIGVFFVAGSLLNFFEYAAVLGNTLYFSGSLILVCRSIYNIKINTTVEQDTNPTDLHQSYY
ncbi:YrhK family protein [Virgibacillus kekensis]|uniref:YrhK family protein n=1 Tax=Virgibacillus kekensis TaxID=202261 RepID=A0ABV9DG01_9BACI